MKRTINRYDPDNPQIGWVLNGQFIEWSFSFDVDDTFILLYGDRDDETKKVEWCYHISDGQLSYESSDEAIPIFSNSKDACVAAAQHLLRLRKEKAISVPLHEARRCLSEAIKLPLVLLKFESKRK